MSFNYSLVVNNLRAYTPAKLTQGKTDWYISFHAFDPSTGKMKRKRIKINHIASKRERKVYANDLIARINAELINGWNPWVNNTSENSYATIETAADSYRKQLERLCADDHIREKTLKGNLSMLNVLMEYNKSTKNPKKYIYQFNGEFLSEFLDYIWLEKGNSGTTRHNYIIWLKSFAKFLLSKQYVEVDPTSTLQSLGKKKSKKERLVIAPEHMTKLKNYCEETNKHYLLACYILYYCFIRQKEMSHIKLEHISIQKGTIFIPDKNSKNRKDGTVTLPDKVIKLMVELDIFKHPSSYYLFGKYFKPVPHTVIQTEHLSTLLSLSPSTVRHSSHPGYASLFRARCEALWSENSCGCRPRTPSFVSEETVVPQRRILHSHLTGETSRSTGRCYRKATSF